jgi:hypothetical protein
MRTKYRTILFLFFAFFIVSQANAEEEQRNVPAFSKISLRIPGVLYVEQGESPRLTIEAKSSTLERIITEVRGEELIIRFENTFFFWENFNAGSIKIYATAKEIEGLALSGSGDIRAPQGLHTRNMDLRISGSGNISLAELNAEETEVSISGSGDVHIADGGNAKRLSISISGSGDVDASGFETKEISVRVSGSGDSRVYATEKLEIKVSGSGDVYYSGNPEINSSVSGSGSVKKSR